MNWSGFSPSLPESSAFWTTTTPQVIIWVRVELTMVRTDDRDLGSRVDVFDLGIVVSVTMNLTEFLDTFLST